MTKQLPDNSPLTHIDMLMVDRLRAWSHHLEYYRFVVAEMGRIADGLEAAIKAVPWWRPIATAPTDGTRILVYAPAREGLDAIVCPCAYHPDAGFCVDELRVPTHWLPLPAVPSAGVGAGSVGSDGILL